MRQVKGGQLWAEEERVSIFPLEEWQVLAMINDLRMIGDLPSWKR